MIKQTPRELLDKGLISEDQFNKIDFILSGKLVSVFYELRSLLYLGVLFFTTGAGLLIYENIGELGHVVSILLLSILMAICFWHAFSKVLPYSHETLKSPTPYFDYIVLLGSLLFVSILGYLEYQYGIFSERIGLVTLFTSLVLFFIAYRFDHIGVLSLAITALASYFSISISPQKWYRGDDVSLDYSLHLTAIVFGAALCAVALVLEKRSIKKHFTFTYLNFGSLIFFIGTIAGLFTGKALIFYNTIILGGCAFAYVMATTKKSFLFMLYAFVAAYIGTTAFLATFLSSFFTFWFYYSILSCGAFIFFIIRYRNHFNRNE